MDEATRGRIYCRLSRDPIWCAYALADLDPAEDARSEWHINQEAVLLLYHGLKPPILFSHGTPDEASPLFERIPPAQYQFALRHELRATIETKLSAWRKQNANMKVYLDYDAPVIDQPNVPPRDLSHREAIIEYYRRKMHKS